jgi:methylation protein EvaC
MLEAETHWHPERFAAQVEDRRQTLRALVGDLRRAGKRVVAYGAAGRSTILLNFCGLGPDLVEYVLDMSPLRYGKFVPGVSIPIVPPDAFHARPPDYAIMTAWNYEPEIVVKERAYLAAGGRFIVPLPEIRIVEAG